MQRPNRHIELLLVPWYEDVKGRRVLRGLLVDAKDHLPRMNDPAMSKADLRGTGVGRLRRMLNRLGLAAPIIPSLTTHAGILFRSETCDLSVYVSRVTREIDVPGYRYASLAEIEKAEGLGEEELRRLLGEPPLEDWEREPTEIRFLEDDGDLQSAP